MDGGGWLVSGGERDSFDAEMYMTTAVWVVFLGLYLIIITRAFYIQGALILGALVPESIQC